MPRSPRRHNWNLALLGLGLLACFVYRPLFEGRVLAGRDVFRLFIPDTAFLLECVRRGEWPLWNPYQRLGQPFLATMASQALYPPRVLLALAVGPVWASSLEQVFHALVAALGTFQACRRLGAGPRAASIGGAAFAFGPLFTQLGVQQNVVAAAAWTGFLAAAALTLGRRPGLERGLRLGLFVGLSFLAGSPETLLWQGALVVALLLARRRPSRALASGGLAFGWGLAAVGVVLVPAVELAMQSERVGGAAAPLDWSMPWVSLASLGWLNLDLPRPEYAGLEQNFVPVVFQGSVACALAVCAAMRRPRLRPATALVLVALGLALLSLGANFAPSQRLLSAWPFALFRYPAKYIVGAAFSLCVLAALGLERVRASARHRRPRRAWAAVAIAGAVLVASLALPVTGALGLRQGAGPGLIWAAVFLGLALCASLIRAHLAVAFVVLVELIAVQGLSDMEGWVRAADLTRGPGLGAMIQRPQLGRLSVRLSQDTALSEGMAYVSRSRASLVPLRFVEEELKAVEGYGAPEPRLLDSVLEGAPKATFDLFGVTDYVREGDSPPFPGLARAEGLSGLPTLWRSGSALPRAFVVQEAEVVSDDEALRAVRDGSGPTRARAFLASGARLRAGLACASSAGIVDDGLNSVSVSVDACAEGYLVLSDRFFPGWEAELDGVSSPLLRADLLLRAVRVTPGRHRVTFSYRPVSARLGGALSALAVAGALFVLLRRRLAPRPRPSTSAA